jgi:transposase InsO family protein
VPELGMHGSVGGRGGRPPRPTRPHEGIHLAGSSSTTFQWSGSVKSLLSAIRDGLLPSSPTFYRLKMGRFDALLSVPAKGSQFTSREYSGRLEDAGVAVSRDGRGRALDNVFVGRLWRSVEYEDIYIKDYEQTNELETSLTAYFRFYDEDRPHQSLDYRTPGEVYRAGTCQATKERGS